jgi:hypothetical protein
VVVVVVDVDVVVGDLNSCAVLSVDCCNRCNETLFSVMLCSFGVTMFMRIVLVVITYSLLLRHVKSLAVYQHDSYGTVVFTHLSSYRECAHSISSWLHFNFTAVMYEII